MDTPVAVPALPPSLWRRAWGAVLRALPRRVPKVESDHHAGADFAEDLPAQPGYDPRKAMSAHAAFPWNFAAVSAVATDFAGLPWVIQRGRGKKAERLESHPLLDLLEQPSSRVNGEELWRQVVVDLRNSGEFFLLRIGTSRTTSLLRLHPARVTPLTLPDGQPGDFRMMDGTVYSWQHVLYGRLPSWADGPESIRGTGSIQPLHNALTAIQAAQENAARSAKVGRPTGILRPSDAASKWDDKQVKRVRVAWEGQLGGKSGVVIIGEGGAEYQSLGWSPADLEYTEQEALTRDQTLAVHDVTPTRVGIPNANFATDEAQNTRYWQGMMSLSRLICAKLTLLAREYDSTLVVGKDFSGVEALQQARTERQTRVKTWTDLGLDLQAAAAYEGFDDLPAPVKAPAAKPVPGAAPAAEDADEEAALVAEALTLAGRDEYDWAAPVLRAFAAAPAADAPAAPSLLASAARLYDPEHARALVEDGDLGSDPLAALCLPHLRACLAAGGIPRSESQRLAVMLREAFAGLNPRPSDGAETALRRARWLIVGAEGQIAQRDLIATRERERLAGDWLHALPLELVTEAA